MKIAGLTMGPAIFYLRIYIPAYGAKRLMIWLQKSSFGTGQLILFYQIILDSVQLPMIVFTKRYLRR